MYLLNCLKSSWALVRVYSFEILCKIPENNAILTDEQFINQEILSTALIFCNNPKAMVPKLKNKISDLVENLFVYIY